MSTDRLVNSPNVQAEGAPPEVRERILDSARHQFGQRGYDAASLREVAAAAGVTKPMVYYYFGSKEGLYRTLLDEAFAAFRDALDQAVAPEDGRSTRERLAALARVHAELARSRAADLRLMVSASVSAQAGPAAEVCRALEEVHQRVIERIVRDGLRRGELRGAAEHLIIAIRTLMTSFHSAALGGNSLPADTGLPEQLVAFLYDGIAAQPSARKW